MILTIEKLVYGGSGLARTDGGVVFVPRTARGDVVEVEIVQRKKDYAVARIVRILEMSQDRQEPFCPNYETAGCCHWQHIRYDRQVEYKEAIVRESLARLGHMPWNGPVKHITGPDRNYRIRAVFHVANGRLGFIKGKTHQIVSILQCAALVPELNDFIAYANSILEPGMREVHAVSAPAIAASFVFESGLVKNLQHGGEPVLQVDAIRYRLSAPAFVQANRFLLSPFVAEVLEHVRQATNILELYAGSGFFSLPLAGMCQELIGIEQDGAAVRLARENARLNGLPNVRFFERDVDTTLEAGAETLRPDVVVLDPPRTGCGVKNASRIAELSPRRIVYVSCNPSTFAREAAVFAAKGYELTQITLVDQFPHTHHVELVSSFDRVLG